MKPAEKSFEDAVLERVCAVCADRRDDGSCGLDTNLECAIRKHLPRIIESLDGTHSEHLVDYVTPIRSGICSICESENADGSCDVRERVDCPLDRYLSLVIDAIAEVRRERQGKK